MKKLIIILFIVLFSVSAYAAWDPTKPSSSNSWATGSAYTQDNFEYLDDFLTVFFGYWNSTTWTCGLDPSSPLEVQFSGPVRTTTDCTEITNAEGGEFCWDSDDKILYVFSDEDDMFVPANAAGTYTNNIVGTENTGYGTLYIATNAGAAQTTGIGNIGFGLSSLYSNTTGSYNSALGKESMYQNITESYCTGLGYRSLYSLKYGANNTAIGYQAAVNLLGGSDNVSIGTFAGPKTNANYCVALGSSSLVGTTGDDNCGIGFEALIANTTGVQNFALGTFTLAQNVTGSYSTGIGKSVLYKNRTNYNTGIGSGALYNTTWGGKNTAISNNALLTNITGTWNTAIGYEALYSFKGRGTTAVGYNAGTATTALIWGQSNTFLGASTKADATNYSNSCAIGYNAQITASNQVVIGDANVSSFKCKGIYSGTSAAVANVNVTSDGQVRRSTSSKRYKENIRDIETDTSVIYNLRPVTFKSKIDNQEHIGLIAEEVDEVMPEVVEYARAKDVIEGSTSDKNIPESVQYSLLVVPIINELKKLKAENEALKLRIEALENR